MTREEFFDRTEHYPSDDEWRLITKDYLKNDWENKDMFCRRWLIEHGLYHKIAEIGRKRQNESLKWG